MTDSKHLKEILGQGAKSIIANGLGFVPNRTGFVTCPLHDDKHPSMSWYKDGMMWRCHSCGGNIDIYEYYTKFEHMSFPDAVNKVAEMVGYSLEPNRATKQQYILPNIKTRELSQAAIDLMAERSITKETLDAWRVREYTWNKANVYVYQYFHNDTLKHVTYREVKAGGFKGGCEKNTESILWGMWHVEDGKPLVITEGQPDAMAVWQSGYTNVVSVPSGANNLNWIENCWDWLKGREIILWADNDKRGIELADNVSRRLENVKVIQSDLKDANDVLCQYGPKMVVAIITDAINEMPSGMLDVANVEYRATTTGGIETGFIEYDSFVEDWKEGELTVIFGRNGEGKTTFVSQIIAHCLEKRVKTFLYSGEMSEYKIQDWLYKQLIGNKKKYMNEVKAKYRIKNEIKPEIIKRIKEWHRGIFYLFDKKDEKVAKDLDKFFNLMVLAAKKNGVKLFIIDNLMSRLEENADSLNSDQANFVQRCKDFADRNSVHVVLVAHPNKCKDEITKDKGNLDKTDISGSNNIPNKADNIIAVERVWGDDRACDAIITSLKDREVGERKSFKYYFSQRTLRLYNNRTPEDQVYGWEDRYEQVEIDPDIPWGSEAG